MIEICWVERVMAFCDNYCTHATGGERAETCRADSGSTVDQRSTQKAGRTRLNQEWDEKGSVLLCGQWERVWASRGESISQIPQGMLAPSSEKASMRCMLRGRGFSPAGSRL